MDDGSFTTASSTSVISLKYLLFVYFCWVLWFDILIMMLAILQGCQLYFSTSTSGTLQMVSSVDVSTYISVCGLKLL